MLQSIRFARLPWLVAMLMTAPAAFSAEPPTTLRTEDGAEMVLVPAGRFVMGSHEGAPEESPPHERELPAFYIDRTEVTVGQYHRFLTATGRPAPAGWTNPPPPSGTETRPVTNLRWSDAMHYALWAGKRLPTEPEWEKAARGSDGRRFPWGDADDNNARNLESGKLRPVGTYPDGASPFGCLDMSGNAWEWTADWFLPYPGTTARSVHFGRDFKVIRGGAGEYLYATENTGTTGQRARLVPYGSHDFIGFRCVKDVPGHPAPYDRQERLAEAESLLTASLHAPRVLAHERQFEALQAAGQIPLTVRGALDQAGLVTTGFPLPRGRVQQLEQLALRDRSGQLVPLAVTPLATWPDDSLRWVLLQFHGASDHTYQVCLLSAPASGQAWLRPTLRLGTNDQALELDTGAIQIAIDRQHLVHWVRRAGKVVCRELTLQMAAAGPDGRVHPLRAGPADSLEVESRSPLASDLRLRGPLLTADGGRGPGPMAYDLRVRASAGSSQLRLWLTVLHAAPREQPWEDLKPQVAVSDWRVGFRLPGAAPAWVLGGEAGPVHVTNAGPVQLQQPDDVHYTLQSEDQVLAQGTRAPGWLTAVFADAAVSLGVRDFWQNHPKQLYAAGDELGIGLWAGAEPFGWEGGLAKTHELVLEIGPTPPTPLELTPLRAVVDPAWMCGTEAAGALLPRNEEALRHFGYWECWRETAMRHWVKAMPTGLRDFGDGYMGGPYKGKNAYMNLEYDVPMNFLFQFLRTGELWYFEAAEAMARHQADVDIENVSGFAWKHSPLHTTTQAEFGHVFLRGMLLHHLLTGERRSREQAEAVGAWVAAALLRGHGVGNERQIGWSLYALTALHEVTRDTRYLEAARALCDRLVREQAPTGKFNIRWDNRIAFFNGIAMNGMLGVNEIAPDPALETALMRVAERTLGMYPEYAGRTLSAYAWVVQRTEDPRFLDNMEQTWISSLEFLLDRDPTTAETHAWRFPTFALRYQLFPQFTRDPGELPRACTWQALRFKNRSVDLYLRGQSQSAGEPRHIAFPVLIVREGLAAGSAELFDAENRLLQTLDLHQSDRLLESVSLNVPALPSWCRLRLSSPDAFGWQVHHDARTALTVADPKGEQLPFLLPRATGALRAGVSEITLRVVAEGEGFHRATLYNPHGVPAGRVQRFIDFEDPGRYELELKLPVTGPREGWSVELTGVKVVRLDGFRPYWSSARANWFSPE